MERIGEEQKMTVKEVSDSMGVSTDTIKNCIRRIMPDKMKNGKTTFLDEKECGLISIELKRNNYVIEQLTYEAGSQVKNTTTEFEEQAIVMQAMQIIQRNYEEAKHRAELAEQQVIEMRPKVEFFDTVADSSSLLSMQEVASVINRKGIGRNNLFAILREKNILNLNNLPYRQYIDRDYFKVIEKPVMIKGETTVKTVTMVTQKGVDYIIKQLGGEK